MQQYCMISKTSCIIFLLLLAVGCGKGPIANVNGINLYWLEENGKSCEYNPQVWIDELPSAINDFDRLGVEYNLWSTGDAIDAIDGSNLHVHPLKFWYDESDEGEIYIVGGTFTPNNDVLVNCVDSPYKSSLGHEWVHLMHWKLYKAIDADHSDDCDPILSNQTCNGPWTPDIVKMLFEFRDLKGNG